MLNDDKVLLKGLAEQNQFVIEEFVRLNFNHLLSFVKKYGGTIEDAEDLMQDALVVLYNISKSNKINIEKGIVVYFRGIYKNLWYKSFRNKLKISEPFPGDVDFEINLETINSNIINEIERNERYKLYQKYFSKLSEDCKSILEMLNNGIPVPEIIKELNFTLSYFYKKKSLCRKNLIESIAKDPGYKELKF